MSQVEVYANGATPMMQQAEMLARSNLVPKAFRGKPADVMVAMLLGQELGLGPMATMSMVDVIEGNATLNAEGKVSLVRKAGHSINGEALATRAVAHGKRRDTGDEMSVEWTIDMAQRAGLANKGTWKQYPEAMLWSRAVSQLCRMLFPDVLAGLSYTPEEVESFTPQIAGVMTPPVEAASAREDGPPTPAPPLAIPSPVGREEWKSAVLPSAELQRERMRFVERLELLSDAAKAHAREEWKAAVLPPPTQLSDETEMATADAIISEAESLDGGNG